MIRRICTLAALAAAALSAASGAAEAHWLTDLFASTQRDYHRSKSWPEPFVHADRASVYAPFAIMEANGWRKHHLLSDYHFADDQDQLTEAGLRKARLILTQAPPNRRTIFVQRGDDPRTTTARMQAVHRAVARILPPGELADIQETHIRDDGRPADEVDRHLVKYRDNAPTPKLPSAGAASPGASGMPQ